MFGVSDPLLVRVSLSCDREERAQLLTQSAEVQRLTLSEIKQSRLFDAIDSNEPLPAIQERLYQIWHPKQIEKLQKQFNMQNTTNMYEQYRQREGMTADAAFAAHLAEVKTHIHDEREGSYQ